MLQIFYPSLILNYNTFVECQFWCLRLSVDGLKEPFGESFKLLYSLLALILKSSVLLRQFLYSDFKAASSSLFAHHAI